MPEEWFEVMHDFWNDEYFLVGKTKDGPFKQQMQRNQIGEVESLQSAHDIEMQRLLRSYLND